MRHLLLLSILCLTLVSCGIKPSSVSPPGESSKDVFPATYPKSVEE